jgi:Na+/H+ antiporter NhaC
MNETFTSRLKSACEAGILLFVKYALVVGLIYLGINYITNVTAGANNGTAAAMYLNQLQQKGYLPKINAEGQIPAKIEEPNAKNNQ